MCAKEEVEYWRDAILDLDNEIDQLERDIAQKREKRELLNDNWREATTRLKEEERT